MTILQAILLGIIQGITEFFPVSSSGHLELGQYFLGLTHLEQFIFFNLVCHLGTLLALVIIFSQQIQNAFLSQRSTLAQVAIAILPLFPLLLIMKPLKTLFDQPQYLGYGFLITALLLYIGQRAQPTLNPQKKPWRDALIIGLFQAIAILPGISRSGATISSAKLLGWQPISAVTFSFLLAIPTILGGVFVEMLPVLSGKHVMPATLSWEHYFAGFLTSAIVGYGALRVLLALAVKDKFYYFVWYCIGIGLLCIFTFN